MRRNNKIPLICIFALLFSFTINSFGQEATDEEMTNQALTSHLRTSNIGKILNARYVNRLELSKKNTNETNRNERSYATVIFSPGQTAEEIGAIINIYNLELSRAESKTPTGDNNEIISISVGAIDLLETEGSISERLRYASGKNQFTLLGRYEELSSVDPKAGEEVLKVAATPFLKYYKIEIVGKNKDLDRLLKNEDAVLELFVDEDDINVQSYNLHKSNADLSRQNTITLERSRPFKSGPPPSVSDAELIERFNKKVNTEEYRALYEELKSNIRSNK